MYTRMTVDQLLAKVAGGQPMSPHDLTSILAEMVSLAHITHIGQDTDVVGLDGGDLSDDIQHRPSSDHVPRRLHSPRQ